MLTHVKFTINTNPPTFFTSPPSWVCTVPFVSPTKIPEVHLALLYFLCYMLPELIQTIVIFGDSDSLTQGMSYSFQL